MENSHLTLETEDDAPMDDLIGHSVSYRIAAGPRQGRKPFNLQTVPAHTEERDDRGPVKAAGFSLHCGVAAGAHQRAKLERLCRYIARPAILLLRRITISPGGQIAKHSAATTPGVVYVASVTWTEGRESGETEYSAGETFVEDKETVHWFFNRGSEPAAAYVCDIRPAR